MMNYLAHSARGVFPPQEYAAHVEEVYNKASQFAKQISENNVYEEEFIQIVSNAAIWHDLGKLNSQNQFLLNGTTQGRKLPINHIDAGTAHLLNQEKDIAFWAALVVYSHHKGLPNLSEEECKEEDFCRDLEVRKSVDAELEELEKIHLKLLKDRLSFEIADRQLQKIDAVFMRMALSCLADADHTDTAEHYGTIIGNDEILLKPKERLEKLDEYISALEHSDERGSLRQEMYYNCRNSEIVSGFVSCSSPVGSGKTTAVMAYLLNSAIKNKSIRIFVVLPYTNIIKQSVEIYRKALVLDGENPEEVVAEIHHRADYQNKELRKFSALWKAPIVVTTAAAFFETLASNMPSALRRLHNLANSKIFIDEAHCALPLRLIPLAWRWMNIFQNDWKCNWVLASGTSLRFWEIDSLINNSQKNELPFIAKKVPELVLPDLRKQLSQYELSRVKFCYINESLSVDSLIDKIMSQPAPRLVIMNTIKSAAIIANQIRIKYGKECIEHISNALSPNDIDKTLNRVKQRLSDDDNNEWTLVATSCVEAGVDFSFRTGFREISSVVALLQAAGRVNRNGLDSDAKMWSFQMQQENGITQNPEFRKSAVILKRYFEKEIKIEPSIVTQAVCDELNEYDTESKSREALYENETSFEFKSVAKDFKVINSGTLPVVVDPKSAARFLNGQGDWKELQRCSVGISTANIQKWGVKQSDELYIWNRAYDEFLGIMAGVIL